MKKTILALTGLMLIMACNDGSRSMMSTGDPAVAPLAEDAVCDATALASKIANTPSLTAQPLFYFVADLKLLFPDCGEADVVNLLTAQFVSAHLVKVCPTAQRCHPVYLDIVKAGIEAAIAIESNPADILHLTGTGIVSYSTMCSMPLACSGGAIEEEEEAPSEVNFDL